METIGKNHHGSPARLEKKAVGVNSEGQQFYRCRVLFGPACLVHCRGVDSHGLAGSFSKVLKA